MRRDQLEHIVRAATALIGEDEIVVIGSQAILGSHPEWLPHVVLRSVEADVFPPDDPEGAKSDVIDGAIGEGSMFHHTFGVYAHGVSERTARLPAGWRDRLVPVSNENTRGAVGWCLEPHDLWVSKALAGRPNDLEFCRALLRSGFVDASTLQERLAAVDASHAELEAARSLARVQRGGTDGHHTQVPS
ncbi:MAG TPA: DUF6036 family nucleotidyltransferase [Egibacteraceae bacterium]|nr:DUF6036 family nucleotidyltransferase [Egibacteraceae bacterium]